MNILAATNPFDLRAALLAAHAQHPVIVHFPIALFIASVSKSSRSGETNRSLQQLHTTILLVLH
ncbi:MAG: hypothetical protein DMF39_01275 [Verrucomicrobia bacterium]|nr:MAG: hypothetical protein DMF39_01275 [Verrucomicrobiota bacterium]